jgi:hypothetical protein
MMDEEFNELDELAKDIHPEYQEMIKATTQKEIEVMPGVIGVYDENSGGWLYTDPETGNEAVVIL